MDCRTPAAWRGPGPVFEPEMQTGGLQDSVRKPQLAVGGTEGRKLPQNGRCRRDKLSVSLACPTREVGGNPQLSAPLNQINTCESPHCLTPAFGAMPVK